jgi:hypothetical protein
MTVKKVQSNGAPNNSHPCKHLTYSTNQQSGKGEEGEGKGGGNVSHVEQNLDSN